MRTLSPREMAIAALSEWSCLVNLPGLGGLALGPSHNVAGRIAQARPVAAELHGTIDLPP